MAHILELTLEELLHPKTPLAQLYHKKLPLRKWAGEQTAAEKEYARLCRPGQQQECHQTHEPDRVRPPD